MEVSFVYTVYNHSIRRLGYIWNQQLMDKVNIAWADTRMRKECRAHI
jgi:hypothetical protein